ncbi:MAG: MFS transporter [Spirochaetales bacterium]|nr:MFS transporter [Spirochaetales bacterium]
MKKENPGGKAGENEQKIKKKKNIDQKRAVKKILFRDIQYWKFSLYGFLKNLRFFDPYLLLFFHQAGISYLEIGTLFAVREITTNILEIPSGIFADTFGRRKSMVFCFASYIVSFIVFGFFSNYAAFLLAMAVFAFGEAFRTGTHKAMIIEYLRVQNQTEYKVLYYGHTRAWSQRGSAISAVISGFIVFYSGDYSVIFLYTIIPYVLGMFLMMTYPAYLDFSSESSQKAGFKQKKSSKSSNSELVSSNTASGGESEYADQTVQPVKESLTIMKEHILGLAAMFRDPQTRKGMLNFSIFDSIFKSTKDYIQPVIKQFALSAPILLFLSGEERTSIAAALVYFVLYLISAAASKRSGVLGDMFSSQESGLNWTFAFSVLLMVGIGSSLLYDVYGAAMLLFILYYAIQNIRRPMAVGYLSGLVKNSMMATGLSGESQFKSLITAAAAPLFGWFADVWGIGAAVLIFALLLAATAILCRLKRSAEASE